MQIIHKEYIQQPTKRDFYKQFSSKYHFLPKDPINPLKQDLIKYANSVPPQILVIGKPTSGKTTFCKNLSISLQLIHIEPSLLLKKLYQKVLFYEQNPPQTDENGNPIQVFKKIQKCILQDIADGKQVDLEDLLDLLNIQMNSKAVSNQGYILDLPIDYEDQQFSWLNKLLSNDIYLPKDKCPFFTHIIQLNFNNKNHKLISQYIYERPQDLKRFSKRDIQINNKPKPPPIQQDQDEGNQPQDQQPLPLIHQIQLARIPYYSTQNYENKRIKLNTFIQSIHPKDMIQIQLMTQQLMLQKALLRLNIIRPLAKKLQGSSQKQLLTIGLEQLKIYRNWSQWNTIDPVSLTRNQLKQGKIQFAAEYAGYVFMFDNENNLNEFISNPRIYLKKAPTMISKFNIAIVGANKSGKKTIANSLHSLYGWKLVDIKQLVLEVLQKQRICTQHIPSNFQKRINSVHLNQIEWKQFYKGGPLNMKDVMPIVLHKLGIELQKKPFDWGIDKDNEEERQKQEQKQKQQEKKKIKTKGKKKDKDKDDQRPKTPPPQDLALGSILTCINHLGKLDQIKGLIIIGYPNSIEQLTSLKGFNIPIDKLISLVDMSQQPVNKILSTRLNQIELEQITSLQTTLTTVKQQLGEQIVKQISIQGTKEQILANVRRAIDPFYSRVDIDQHQRISADVQQDDQPIQWGSTTDYCPVIAKQRWLIKGKEDQEAGYKSQRFRFYGQQQLNLFKKCPQFYNNIDCSNIPPRIMFIGVRGVGLTTLLIKLNQKYKIPVLNLKQNILSHLDNMKNQRRLNRYFNKGFKPPQYDEQGKPIPDPQIEDQHAQYDKKISQLQAIKLAFNHINQIFINGNFFGVEQEQVSTPLNELLSQCKRLPQMVVFLKVNDKQWIKRVFNPKQIQHQHSKIIQERKEARDKQRQEARLKAIEAGQQYQEPEIQDQDPDAPKLQDMINERKDKLLAQREQDSNKIDELVQAYTSLNIQTEVIDCQREINKVYEKVVHKIDKLIYDRTYKFIPNILRKITMNKADNLNKTMICIDSRFRKSSPFSLLRPVNPIPVTYKSRIYYLDSQQRYQQCLANPHILIQKEAIPIDNNINPHIFIIGDAKTGKGTIVKQIVNKLGLIKIKSKQLQSTFLNIFTDYECQFIKKQIQKGEQLSDMQLCYLLKKRIGMKDCIQKGWILDGFPISLNQAKTFTQNGIKPDIVFSMALNESNIKSRVFESKNKKYGYKPYILQERIVSQRKQLYKIEKYYQQTYSNLLLLDSRIGIWGLYDRVYKYIEKVVHQKAALIKGLIQNRPCPGKWVGFSNEQIINNLSKFKNFCLVTLTTKHDLVKINLERECNVAFYQNKFYLFADSKYTDFIQKPQLYMFSSIDVNTAPKTPDFQQLLKMEKQIENNGYGVVQLSKNKLVLSNFYLSLLYKNKLYGLSNIAKSQLFKKNPNLYCNARLPDKLPVNLDKKSEVKKIAKRGDCTAFLQHHLGNILMKVLAQLGYRRLKYPTISSKQTALKFIAISLKMYNTNQSEQYRQKYKKKLDQFIRDCNFAESIRTQYDDKHDGKWTNWQEENYLKTAEEFSQFMKVISSMDKAQYFNKFIK